MHIFENPLGLCEILLIAKANNPDVVGTDQCQCPPSLVVVEVVEEVIKTSRLEISALEIPLLHPRVGRERQAGGGENLRRLDGRLLRLLVGVLYGLRDAETSRYGRTQDGEVGQDSQAVGAVPPSRGVPQPRAIVIPGLESLDAVNGVGLVLCRALETGVRGHQERP